MTARERGNRWQPTSLQSNQGERLTLAHRDFMVLKMKIVLCGYRASGKSTLGKLLAKRLNWTYQDIDRGIELRSTTTLTEFYQRDPIRFREVETEVVIEMCQRDKTVISFGAGSLMKERNQQAACDNALVTYLRASVEELWRRSEADPKSADTRPQLAGGGIEEVREMLGEREPIYLKCADLVLDATLSPDQLADAVIREYQVRDRSS